MTGLVDWAAARARMVLAFIMLSLAAGAVTYTALPKEGEPDIEIPALFVSVPFPGISAEDSETLLVRPMETELSDLDGLKTMGATAAEGYAGMALEFEFGWDKTRIMADVRDAMNKAEASFPDGAEQYSINEINFSEFPIIIVSLTGQAPERTLLRLAKEMQDRLEGLEPVLEAAIAGDREEMVEVVIDPLRLEAYNVTAAELIRVVQNNNQLIAAGEVETQQGAFSVKIPSSFDDQQDIYALPVKVNGDRVVTLGDLADIRLTFEDRTATARFNGETTVALQVVKRKGYNLIDTAALIRDEVAAAQETWPGELRQVVSVETSNDQSRQVRSMVQQLEGSVLTAIALVMIVVLGALGIRSALLVGFAIPTSFLLCFILLGLMGITISNIVMFGLILAVGMLVDGAIVVVEYADKRISEGSGPMRAYVEAAKRMFWPIVSSTATTLCAFLPMLFWPGVAGEFMGMLPVTLIFVLSASLIVALVYLPVMGGVAGRLSRVFEHAAGSLKAATPWPTRVGLALLAGALVFVGAMQSLNPGYLPMMRAAPPWAGTVLGALLMLAGACGLGVTLTSLKRPPRPRPPRGGRRRTPFGHVITLIAGNPVMPLVTIGAICIFVYLTFVYYGANNNGTEFFVESEPEQALIYVKARGNLSLAEKDALLREAEDEVLDVVGIQSAFAFAGDGGLSSNTGGAEGPPDAIGQIQVELIPWEDRPAYAASHSRDVSLAQLDGNAVMDAVQARLDRLPGVRTEVVDLAMGPASAKPVHLRLTGDDWDALLAATETARQRFDATPGLIDIEDSRPLPGIDWQIDVDVEKAGRFGADVATVGGMVQLVTRGILLDTMRVPSSDEEIEIRVRLPERDRVLSTLDSLKVRTADGLVPLSNFVTRKPVAKLGQIDRVDQKRHFDVRADVAPGLVSLGTAASEDRDILAVGRVLTPETPSPEGGPTPGHRLDLAGGTSVALLNISQDTTAETLRSLAAEGRLIPRPINPNERIARLTEWLETTDLPAGIDWEWTGDQEDQAESQEFLGKAGIAALGLMFVILLAQFNSFYNTLIVLTAVVLSTTGCLIGMMVMGQPFSIIMTGTGIVALAGIVVNNNIVLIDTYQDYARYMPATEAIIRTAEDRIRPVLLTTITTMAGLAPMMFGLSLDFAGGGYSIDSPTALWWKQLATAVVFGLGIATVLTLVFTPSVLAARVWVVTYAHALAGLLARASMDRSSRATRDWALRRAAARVRPPEILWDTTPASPRPPTLRAAE
ncbi:multidrug efflux pump [Tranquillimonas rosea]|uniref:Multidrug efflux pump n=1 Tax=Tranquillimonas rosea TaxID=641238 RepID=A0A1H9PXE4_9RHOB|nr:efflux RND transporter permease subunit [Tranquillimonas rosea]SER52901.1 multidrug efflux pump [Tranquillimonas rosea]